MTNNKKIVIFGGTGLIGKELVHSLFSKGYQIEVVTRNFSKAYKDFGNKVTIKELNNKYQLENLINGSFAVINLAGENIAKFWSRSNKEKILSSRVNISKLIADAINRCNIPPAILIQASAIGYYNHNSDQTLAEDSPKGHGFLSDVVEKWEDSVKSINDATRVVFIRTGIVLSGKGGFLAKVVLPVKLFVGSWFGSGEQLMSWIHISDHIRAIQFLLENENSTGVYNLVSTSPVTQKNLLKQIGKIVGKPVLFSIPSFMLRIIFREMADQVFLSSQNVVPVRLLDGGFTFEFEKIEPALLDLFSDQKIG